MCIFNWERSNGKTCPLCRAKLDKIGNSPSWTIRNVNKRIIKGVLEDLSEHELSFIGREFEIVLNKIDDFPLNYSGLIAVVQYNCVIIGNIKQGAAISVLDNCIAVFRDSGIVYPCFPQTRKFKRVDKVFLYSVNSL